MKYFSLILCLITLGLMSISYAEAQGPAIFSKPTSKKGSDRPEGGLVVVMPGPDGKVTPPTFEGEAPPIMGMLPPGPPPPEPSEDPPAAEDDENAPPATFMGEPVGKFFGLVVDCSGSMGYRTSTTQPIEDYNGDIISWPTLLDKVVNEAIKTIRDLRGNDYFNIVAFPGRAGPTDLVNPFSNSSVKATKENKARAIEWLLDLSSYGGTPIYHAVEWATKHFDVRTSKFFVLCDGTVPMSLIEEFPTWWKPFEMRGTELVGIFVGGGYSESMQQFVASVGGTFKRVD